MRYEQFSFLEPIKKPIEKHEVIEKYEIYDATNAIEEYFDVLQSGLGTLQKMGLSADYVMRQYPKHLEKLKDRSRVKE